jgi:hypothetical protein
MAAFAMTVIFLAGTVTVFVVVKNNGTSGPVAQKANTGPAPAKAVLPVQTNEPPHIEESNEPGPEIISYRKEPVKTQRAPVKREIAKQIAPPRFEAEGDFYPVTYGGSAEEMSRGGQIVRTEIPRSSLIAMGVDMPIESANEKIKTDLLVGPDGVVRGVRLVK